MLIITLFKALIILHPSSLDLLSLCLSKLIPNLSNINLFPVKGAQMNKIQ